MSAPSTLRGYVELTRVSNVPTIWTNVAAGVVLSGGAAIATGPVLRAATSVSLFYLGGMVLNDLFDVEVDRKKKPDRPLPSGRVPVEGARLFAASLFISAFALLLPAGPRALVAGGALLAAIALYDALHKTSPATVFLMASCRALVYVVGALAVGGAVTTLVLVAAAVQFGYIVALSLLARVEKSGATKVPIPPIPRLLAGISLVDGLVLAILAHPAWLAAGFAGAALTRAGQFKIRGD